MKTKKGSEPRKSCRGGGTSSTVGKEIIKKKSPLSQSRRNMINFFTLNTTEAENSIGRVRSPSWIKYLVTFINRYSSDVDEQDINDWLNREPSLADPIISSARKMYRKGSIVATDANNDFPQQWHEFLKELTDDASSKFCNANSDGNSSISSHVPPLPALENSENAETEIGDLKNTTGKNLMGIEPSRMINTEDKETNIVSDKNDTQILKIKAFYDSSSSNCVSADPSATHGHAFLPWTSSTATYGEMQQKLHNQDAHSGVIQSPNISHSRMSSSVTAYSCSLGSNQDLSDFVGGTDMDCTINETGKDIPACDGKQMESPATSATNTDGTQQITLPQNQNNSFVQQMEFAEEETEDAHLPMEFPPLRRTPPPANMAEPTDFSVRSILNSSPTSSSSEIDVGTEDSPRTSMNYPRIVPQREAPLNAPSTSNGDHRRQYEPIFILESLRAAVGENPAALTCIARFENYINNFGIATRLLNIILMGNRFDSTRNDRSS